MFVILLYQFYIVANNDCTYLQSYFSTSRVYQNKFGQLQDPIQAWPACKNVSVISVQDLLVQPRTLVGGLTDLVFPWRTIPSPASVQSRAGPCFNLRNKSHESAWLLIPVLRELDRTAGVILPISIRVANTNTWRSRREKQDDTGTSMVYPKKWLASLPQITSF